MRSRFILFIIANEISCFKLERLGRGIRKREYCLRGPQHGFLTFRALSGVFSGSIDRSPLTYFGLNLDSVVQAALTSPSPYIMPAFANIYVMRYFLNSLIKDHGSTCSELKNFLAFIFQAHIRSWYISSGSIRSIPLE